MKKTQILAIVALAVAATFQTAAKAEDPVSPVQGAVCNLYYKDINDVDWDASKTFVEIAASLPRLPAVATFVDTAGDFKETKKKDGLNTDIGMWTGWLKQEKAGTYTFLCRRDTGNRGQFRYSIWINEQKCVEVVTGQSTFNVDLNAGFNSVKVVTFGDTEYNPRPLSITYKKAASLKDPVSFGPGDMFYDEEE